MIRISLTQVLLAVGFCCAGRAGEAGKQPDKAGEAAKPEKKPARPVVLIRTSMGEVRAELFSEAAPETVANFIGLAEGRKEFTDARTGKKAKRPFYDGLIFHRVIKNFMIQGGCPQGTGSGGPGYRFKDEINATGLGLDKLKCLDDKGAPNRLLGIRSRADFQRTLLMPLLRKMKVSNQEELQKRQDDVKRSLESMTVKQAYENLGYRYDQKLPARHPRKGVLAMANSGPNTNGSQFFINLVDTPWLAGKHTVFGRVTSGMDVVEKIGSVKVGAGARPLEPVRIESIRAVKRGGTQPPRDAPSPDKQPENQPEKKPEAPAKAAKEPGKDQPSPE